MDAGAWFNYPFLTSKERDNETGLDFFEARYYSSTQGRFTSPDPLLASGKPMLPQSWNRYVYCINSPLVLIDPSGLDWGVTEWDDKKGHHWNYRWFDGKIGKHDGRTYTAVNFGKGGSLDIAADNGSLVRISNRGIIRQEIPGPGQITIAGQDRVNGAAGNFDGTFPFGRQIREGLLGPGGVDTNSPEYQNASMIGEGVVQGSLFFMGGLLEGAGNQGAEGAAKLIEEAASKGLRFGPDQDALIQLAKEAKRTGATPEQAKTLIDWARNMVSGQR